MIAFAAVGLAAFASSAQATNLVQNGDFTETTLVTSGPFVTSGAGSAVASIETDWFVNCNSTALGGCGIGDPDLTVVFPGTGTTDYGYNGFALYPGFAPDTMPATGPDGTNFVAADGDSAFSASFFQTISGLVPGQSYVLTFDQAAAQQVGKSGATTEQWEVSLGSETEFSTLMNNSSEGFTPWNAQTMTFTATSATEVLTFLSLGTPGGGPPIGLLDSVSLTPASQPPSGTPEPSGLALMGLGAFGIYVIRRYRPKRVTNRLGR